MVNADGQLYTIEGIAAGLMLLMTAYIVVNSTSVYTPGDTHISDMQAGGAGKRCPYHDEHRSEWFCCRNSAPDDR